MMLVKMLQLDPGRSLMSRKERVKDTWSTKKWFTVLAPPYFGNVEIGLTPANSPEKILGRVMETTLYDITGDFSLIHVKLYFKIINVSGDVAQTEFHGHEFARDFLRSLIRRGSSKVEGIFDVVTRDGRGLRVYPVAFTVNRIKTSQEKAIRKVMKEIVENKAKQLDYGDFAQEMVLGKVGSEIYNLARKIAPLRKCDVWKSKPIKLRTRVVEVGQEAVQPA
ncbi:MAG: 30S ribosomal protein S3ae [Candidatus Freyarchaeota archaeon]